MEGVEALEREHAVAEGGHRDQRPHRDPMRPAPARPLGAALPGGCSPRHARARIHRSRHYRANPSDRGQCPQFTPPLPGECRGTRSGRPPARRRAGLRRVGGPVEQERQLLPLGRAEVAQDEHGGVHPPRWPADAEPDPVVLTRAERGGHRPQAVVPVVAASPLEPDGAERKVQLIVDHHDPPGGDPVVARQAGHGATGEVHVGQRLAEGDRLPGQAPLRGRRPELARAEPGADPLGQHVRHHGADVVPVAGVAGPGIAQPGNEPAVAGHAGTALPAQQAVRRTRPARPVNLSRTTRQALVPALRRQAPRRRPPRARAAPPPRPRRPALRRARPRSARRSGPRARAVPGLRGRSPG